MDEKRFIDIEVKILQQELLLEELHQVLYKQQSTIDHLEAQLSNILKRVQGEEGAEEIGPHDQKPPHY